MSITRPKIFDPTILLYDRPVHPEFFRIVASKSIVRDCYEVSLSITDTGHLLYWSDGNIMLTEVLNTNRRELPSPSLFCGSLNDRLENPLNFEQDVFYHHSSWIEEVSSDFFHVFEKEFLGQIEPEGLLYRFGFSGRVNLGGISYIALESRHREIRIRAIHTFPDDSAFLRTDTVFQSCSQ